MSAFRRMLNGSCTCEDVLACVYGLNDLETAIYFALLEDPETRMDEIAETVERERSTAYRAVQRLVATDLVERETVSMDAGGYYHIYRPVDPQAVRERVETKVQEFRQNVEEKLDRFEERVREHGASPLEPGANPAEI